MKWLFSFPALCAFPFVFTWVHRCPPAEDLAPSCSCTKTRTKDVLVICNHLDHSHALSEQLSVLKNYVVDGLVVDNSGLLEMVQGPFKTLNIHRLTFRNCIFGNLPLLSSFNGIQHTLEELKFQKCKVSQWIWSTGTHFSFLKTLIFMSTNLPAILQPKNFEKFPNRIEKLMINDCKVERLEKSSLKKFAHLKSLYLEDNRLTSISRDSLPFILPRLIILSLRGNPLETLSNDIFKHMPRLEYLYLGDTKFKNLQQEIFEPIWHQLEGVFFNNVHLKCNCNSTWLISVDWKKLGQGPFCDNFKKPIKEITQQEICPK